SQSAAGFSEILENSEKTFVASGDVFIYRLDRNMRDFSAIFPLKYKLQPISRSCRDNSLDSLNSNRRTAILMDCSSHGRARSGRFANIQDFSRWFFGDVPGGPHLPSTRLGSPWKNIARTR